MPRTRDPFEAALEALRRSLTSGEFPPGRAIVIADAARNLRLSTTPVREALARLAGEGLLDPAPGGGYVALRLDAADIGERYALNEIYVAAALRLTATATTAPAAPGPVPAEAAAVFDRLVLRAANRTLGIAYARLGRQLALIRRVEPAVFDDLAQEAAVLAALETGARWTDLSEAVAAYHQRRQAAVGALMVSLHFGAPPAARSGR
jgi:DNA-binding GntR family transcriptional regulator